MLTKKKLPKTFSSLLNHDLAPVTPLTGTTAWRTVTRLAFKSNFKQSSSVLLIKLLYMKASNS